MLVPAHPGAGAERLGDAGLGLQRAEREHERPGNVHAALGVGERERLLLGQPVSLRPRVVLDVPSGRLTAQPLGDVAGTGLRPLGEFLRAGGSGGEGPVQAEAVPDDHVPGREGGPEVGDEPTEEFLQFVHVDSHDVPP